MRNIIITALISAVISGVAAWIALRVNVVTRAEAQEVARQEIAQAPTTLERSGLLAQLRNMETSIGKLDQSMERVRQNMEQLNTALAELGAQVRALERSSRRLGE